VHDRVELHAADRVDEHVAAVRGGGEVGHVRLDGSVRPGTDADLRGQRHGAGGGGDFGVGVGGAVDDVSVGVQNDVAGIGRDGAVGEGDVAWRAGHGRQLHVADVGEDGAGGEGDRGSVADADGCAGHAGQIHGAVDEHVIAGLPAHIHGDGDVAADRPWAD